MQCSGEPGLRPSWVPRALHRGTPVSESYWLLSDPQRPAGGPEPAQPESSLGKSEEEARPLSTGAAEGFLEEAARNKRQNWGRQRKQEEKPKQRRVGGRGLRSVRLCRRAGGMRQSQTASRLRVSGQQRGARSVSPSPRLPSQAVTPTHNNHTGSFIC